MQADEKATNARLLGGEPEHQTGEPDPGLVSTTVNLLISAVGVGMLSFPYAFRQSGLIGCALLTGTYTPPPLA